MLARRFSLRALFGVVVFAALACLGLRWVVGLYVQATGVPRGDAATVVRTGLYADPALTTPIPLAAWQEAASVFQFARPVANNGYYCDSTIRFEITDRGQDFLVTVAYSPETGQFAVERKGWNGEWLGPQFYESLDPDGFGAAVRRMCRRIGPEYSRL